MDSLSHPLFFMLNTDGVVFLPEPHVPFSKVVESVASIKASNAKSITVVFVAGWDVDGVWDVLALLVSAGLHVRVVTDVPLEVMLEVMPCER